MDAREVIVLQLPLLSLTRTEEELVPVQAELVSLMAHILVTVFQTGKDDR
jgi:hypothetical protein